MMLDFSVQTWQASQVFPLLAQADGGAGFLPVFIVVAILLVTLIAFFTLRTRGKEVPPKAEPRDDGKGDKPTADLLETREEVEAPVEIHENMSLAEIKRAKMARVVGKKGEKGKRETAQEATERSIAELEAEKQAKEALADDAEAPGAGQQEVAEASAAMEETSSTEKGADKVEEAVESEEAEEIEKAADVEAEIEGGESEEPVAAEEAKEEAAEVPRGEDDDLEASFETEAPSEGLGAEPSIVLPKPKARSKLDGTEGKEKKPLPRPGGLKLPKPASLVAKKPTVEKSEEVAPEPIVATTDSETPEVEKPEVEEPEVAKSQEVMETVESTPVEAKEGGAPKESKEVEPLEEEKSLRDGLAKTRTGFIDRLGSLFKGEKLDDDLVEEVEEILFTADIGVTIAQDILATVERQLSSEQKQDPSEVWAFIRSYCEEMLKRHQEPIDLESHNPFVMLVIGINGVGKTTTIGKIASQLQRQGKSVTLVAGDTFRAAAVDQLEIWAKRTGISMHRGDDQADPSSVIFGGIEKGIAEKADVIICDTAGRLHTKSNLMDELEKMARVAGKALDGAPHETLLVLDANTGQNAIRQAELFNEALDITGVALTKLDGTAKGGVILGICDELKVPVRYIGIGEGIRDLRPFDAEEFVEALFM